MVVRLENFDGQPCDLTGKPMTNAVGFFARGATGRVCLVMVGECREGETLSTLEEVETWAESVPGGYLDY
jgi:hypothetical protein